MASGKVTIYFKNDGGQSDITPSGVNKEGKVSKPSVKTNNVKNMFSSAITRRAINTAIGLVQQVVGYEIDKNYDLSDNVRAKRDKTIATTLVKRVAQNVNSAWAGVNLGSIFGPVGAIIGGIVGGATDLTRQGIDIAHGYDKQSIEIAKANEQLTYSRLRSGYSLMVGSKGEER